jgi:hypothetical protein
VVGQWTTYQSIVVGNTTNQFFQKIHNRSSAGYVYISSVSYREANGLCLLNGPSFNLDGYLDFDGTNDVASYSVEINTAGSFTVEIFTRCDTMTTDGFNRQTIFCFNTGTGGYQLLDLEIWGDKPQSFNGDGNNYTGGPRQLTSSNINSNEWHYYALSSSNGVWTWYIDGSQVDNYTPTYTGISKYFQLGARGNGFSGTGQIWNGKFGLARIYNRSLTSSEILQNYNAQKSRFGL